MNEKEKELIYIVITNYDDNPDYDTIKVFKNIDKASAYFNLSLLNEIDVFKAEDEEFHNDSNIHSMRSQSIYDDDRHIYSIIIDKTRISLIPKEVND